MLSFYWTVFLWRGKNNKRFASSEITHLCYRSICWQKSCTLLGARNTVDNPEQDFFAHCINSIIETCTPGQIKIAHICSKFLLLHWKGTKSLPHICVAILTPELENLVRWHSSEKWLKFLHHYQTLAFTFGVVAMSPKHPSSCGYNTWL